MNIFYCYLQVVQLKKNIDIYDFKFIDGCYSEDETLVISLKIFKDLDILNTFKIEENVSYTIYCFSKNFLNLSCIIKKYHVKYSRKYYN